MATMVTRQAESVGPWASDPLHGRQLPPFYHHLAHPRKHQVSAYLSQLSTRLTCRLRVLHQYMGETTFTPTSSALLVSESLCPGHEASDFVHGQTTSFDHGRLSLSHRCLALKVPLYTVCEASGFVWACI